MTTACSPARCRRGGVDAGAVLRSLLERDLLRIAGHREVPGRPLLYATSRRFLEIFGLARIEDLPTLRDLAELAPTAPAAGDATPVSVDTASDSDGAELAEGDALEASEDDADLDLDAADPDADAAFDDEDDLDDEPRESH